MKHYRKGIKVTVWVISQARLPEDFERDFEELKAKRVLAAADDYIKKTEPSLLGSSIISLKTPHDMATVPYTCTAK